MIDVLDTIIENADGGNDTVLADFSYSLDNTYLENLTLQDGALIDALGAQGNAADNVLTGNAADNLLEVWTATIN